MIHQTLSGTMQKSLTESTHMRTVASITCNSDGKIILATELTQKNNENGLRVFRPDKSSLSVTPEGDIYAIESKRVRGWDSVKRVITEGRGNHPGLYEVVHGLYQDLLKRDAHEELGAVLEEKSIEQLVETVDKINAKGKKLGITFRDIPSSSAKGV